MMTEIEIDLDELWAAIDARRAVLGITEADDEACRNSGLRRTPEKRALLQRMAERCRAAGIEPLKANY